LKLGKLYSLVVKFGMEADPRPRSRVLAGLARSRKSYRKLKGANKTFFDKEKFTNPYADTRILHGDRSKDIKTIMVGIDMGGEELLLCDRLNQMGSPIDLVMSHHPAGHALAMLPEVMNIHSDLLNKQGIPLDIAQDIMDERIKQTARHFKSRNYRRYVDIARLLDIPYICCHTVADNHVTSFLQGLINKARPKKLKDILAILERIPEYKEAMSSDAGPNIVLGKPDSRAGKVFVDMTGGTEGSKRAFARLSQAGVGTLVSMHLSEDHIRAAKKEYINLIIANHIASDNIGINLLLDKLSKKEDLEFIACSGFTRVER